MNTALVVDPGKNAPVWIVASASVTKHFNKSYPSTSVFIIKYVQDSGVHTNQADSVSYIQFYLLNLQPKA